MNKKDIALIKKQFKFENLDFSINKLQSSYVDAQNSIITFVENARFNMLDEGRQELYYSNFKKMLTGEIGSKIFELEFIKTQEENCGQKLFYDVHQGEKSFASITKEIVDKNKYQMDYIITLISGTFQCQSGKKDDQSYSIFNFTMGTINLVTPAKKALKVDYKNHEIITTPSMEMNINTAAPIEGFMFPAFNDNREDVNKIIYYTKTANQPNLDFVNNVLGSNIEMTGLQEKEKFTELLKTVIGDGITTEMWHDIHSQINQRVVGNKSSEIPNISKHDISSILKNSGVPESAISKVGDAYTEIIGEDNYLFKANNLCPDFESKSIKINQSHASISIRPKDIKNMRQIVQNGKKCLLIEIDESLELDGFTLIPEK